MTFRQLVTEAAETIRQSEIPFCDTPLLDASVLLAFAANLNREKLFASYPDEVPEDISAEFRNLIDKRISGMPVSYIRNLKEFYGREFFVDESVLVPRPDTEIIVEQTISLIDSIKNEKPQPKILDLCTGSGCIAVTLKLERPDCVVAASDISAEALKTAKENAGKLGSDIDFIKSNLFNNIANLYDIIVTNPPYLKETEICGMKNNSWPEPMLALDGGTDGLNIIREIIKTSLDYMENNAYLLIEAGPDQADTISTILENYGFKDIKITLDLAGRKRVTSGRNCGT